MVWWEKYKVDLEPGELDGWKLSQFEVSESVAGFTKLRMMLGHPRDYVPPGTYTKLEHGDELVMSDTYQEILDHYPPIQEAAYFGGHCLVNGLGIGMVTAALLELDKVEKVTVVEIAEPVIHLVGEQLQKRFGCQRLDIVHADVLTCRVLYPGVRFSVVWHDIWSSISDLNLPDMHRLHRRYGRRCDWQGSWARRECEDFKREISSWQNYNPCLGILGGPVA